MILRLALITIAAAVPLTPASAQLAEPVRMMIEAAIKKGDAAQIDAVVALARETQPQGLDEIERLYNAWRAQQSAVAAVPAPVPAAVSVAPAADAPKEQARWSGKGEIGAFRATGNGSNSGGSFALNVERNGTAWSHKLAARADYQSSNGSTTREQFLASYEPRYQVHTRLFAYGLLQAERDRIQGFSARYAVSGGVGYHVVDREVLDLSVKVGPALRSTHYVAGGQDLRLAALLGLDFDWKITNWLALTQDTNAVAETGGQATLIIASRNTTLNIVTALEAKIAERLSTRFSYSVDHDSSPPPGGVATDTYSRFTLAYGF